MQTSAVLTFSLEYEQYRVFVNWRRWPPWRNGMRSSNQPRESKKGVKYNSMKWIRTDKTPMEFDEFLAMNPISLRLRTFLQATGYTDEADSSMRRKKYSIQLDDGVRNPKA